MTNSIHAKEYCRAITLVFLLSIFTINLVKKFFSNAWGIISSKVNTGLTGALSIRRNTIGVNIDT